MARILRQNVARDRTVTAVEPWTCPSCRRAIATPYCPTCGERQRSPRELTLIGLCEHAFEAFTNVDGRLLRTFRGLVTAPGMLTVAFVEGRRKPYLGPVALFLVANVVFFGAESLTHGFVFSTPLASHLNTQPWSTLVQPMVAEHLASKSVALEWYAPRFDAAIALHARSMILLMVLAFSPVPALVYYRRGQPFATHVVFSLHLYAFMLLILSAGMAVPEAPVLVGGTRSTSDRLDAVLSIALLIACALYLYAAIGAVYGGGRYRRVAPTIVLTVAVAAIVLGYRFALFLITLYTT
jgi:hypothetical protein